VDSVRFGELLTSRFIIGSNPISGFSHQTPERDAEMRGYFTVARVKALFRQAEGLGINTVIARADAHITRIMMEYRAEGGALRWFAQSCPEFKSFHRSLSNALLGGASALYLHGGEADFRLAHSTLAEARTGLDRARAAGLATGVAGHNPEVFRFAETPLDCDFYMCSYYNSARRDCRPNHVSGMAEWFHDDDRARMIEVIRDLSRPVIHYKVLAAGRNDPAAAFEVAARAMRPTDAVCVGVFPKDDPDMLAVDVALFEEAVAAARV